MELILTIGRGIVVTATPRMEGGQVLLDLHADTPKGPVDITAKTSIDAVRAMIARRGAGLSPQIAAFVDRVLGLSGNPPMPRGEGAPPEASDMTSVENPFANMTGVGESVSAGQWSYGPYFLRVPVRYRVRRQWNTLPWWWPRTWYWPGRLLPYGQYDQYGQPLNHYANPNAPYDQSGAYTGPSVAGRLSSVGGVAGRFRAPRSVGGCSSCGSRAFRFR